MVCIDGLFFISAFVHPFFCHLSVVRLLYHNTTRRWRLATFSAASLQWLLAI